MTQTSVTIFIFAALLPVVAAAEISSSSRSRDSAASLFAKGNEAYLEAKRLASEGKIEAARTKFGQAEVCYEAILQSGLQNWQVYYNLGNALYQQGAFGKAIAAYRRALRLAPRQEDIQINLEKAKTEARDKEALPQTPGIVRALLFPYYQFTLREMALAAFYVYLLFGVLLVAVVFVRTSWLKALCGLTLAVSVALGGVTAAKIYLEQATVHGVIISEVSAVRVGPGPEYDKRFEAHEGAELIVLARHKDPKTSHEWLKARLFIEARRPVQSETVSNAESAATRVEGWIEAKDVELW